MKNAVALRLAEGIVKVHEALVPQLGAAQLLKEYPVFGVAVIVTEVPAG